MAGITLEIAEANLAEALAARSRTLNAESYKIADRELQRSRLDQINADITHWNSMVQSLSARASGRRRARTVVVGG